MSIQIRYFLCIIALLGDESFSLQLNKVVLKQPHIPNLSSCLSLFHFFSFSSLLAPTAEDLEAHGSSPSTASPLPPSAL